MPKGRLYRRFFALIGYGLRRKLTVVFGLLISFFVLSAVYFNVQTQSELVRERLALKTRQVLELGREISVPHLVQGRPGELEAIFEKMSSHPEVENFYLLDEYGTLIADGADEEIAGFLMEIEDPIAERAFESEQQIRQIDGNVERIADPIILGNRYYGTMRLDIRLDTLQNEIRTVWMRNAGLGAVFIVLGLVTSSILARRLVEPLTHLTRITESAAAGNLDQKINVNTNDEIGSLATSFDAMLRTMRGSIQQIHRLAYIDELTGIPNRTWFNEQIERATVSMSLRRDRFAVMFLDVDDFKSVNDQYGHPVGDELLTAMAQRLTACVSSLGLRNASIERPQGLAQSSALVARLGGDEFTVILPVQHAERMAEQVIKAMAEPISISHLTLGATTSIGIGVFPDHADSPEELLKISDVAMYQAKEAGQNCYRFYDEGLHEEQVSKAQLQSDLKTAIKERQFVLYLQPQFEVSTGILTGAEGLIRWEHPSRGLLSPDRFLPTAARSGLMPSIGLEISSLAIEIAKNIQATQKGSFTLAINLSVEELVAPGFMDQLLRMIEMAHIDPKGLEIEITENTAMFDDDFAAFNLERLRALGVKLAIDDFGVGFSNLARLRALAFDTLKIDKSLLPQLDEIDDAKTLFHSIVEISHVVDAHVVAEGIETPQQLSFLRRTGCQYYQGYLSGRPMPAHDFVTWMKNDQAEVLGA